MFVTRTISGIVLLAITLAVVITGGPVLLLAVCAISLIGLFELYRVFQIEKRAVGMVGYLGTIGLDLVLYFGKTQLILPVFTICFLLLMAVYVLSYPKFHANDVAYSFFGLFYVSFLLSFIFQTRMGDDGAYLVWLIFVSAWGTDTCAYLTGICIGKHKMAPVLSPKKSIEGAVGGIVGAAVLGIVYGIVFREHLTAFTNPPVYCAVICVCGGLLSMIGDLCASAIKRNFEIKDYGTLIPGHGGIMDRFDSIIITAPVIFYVAELLKYVFAA